jgi:excisionase family DNA binding protein
MTRGNTGRNWNGNDPTEEVVSTPEVELFENGIVKLVWTVDDVANELKCSVRHIRKLVSEDRIPFFKVGRLVRFSPLRLREWLQKGGTR